MVGGERAALCGLAHPLVAQFDVYRAPDGFALDCQSDLMADYDTRFTVPLLMPEHAPKPARRLNPIFRIEGQDVVMVTQFAGAVPRKWLREKIVSLAGHELDIKAALDMLIIGF